MAISYNNITYDKILTPLRDKIRAEFKGALPTYFDSKIKSARGQFSKVKSQSKVIKAQIQENLKNLAVKGFLNKKVKIAYRGGVAKNQFINKEQLILPLVTRKTMADGRTVMLVLQRYQRDGKYESNVDLNALLSIGETTIYGNFAEYKIVEGGPQGSKDQWAGGFLFGERPSEQEINNFYPATFVKETSVV